MKCSKRSGSSTALFARFVQSVLTFAFLLFTFAPAPSARAQVRTEQVEREIYDGTVYACDSATGSDTYACTPPGPNPGAYTSKARYVIKVDVGNVGPASANLWGLGATTIKKWVGGSKTDLATGDIGAGQVINLIYDGTDMIATSLGGGGGGGGGGVSGLTAGTIPKALSSSSLQDSAIIEDSDSVNISKPVEIGNVATNKLQIDTTAITGTKTYSAARNADGDLAITTGSLTPGHLAKFDSSGRLVDSPSGTIGTRVYNSANISINTATDTILTFDSERWDTDTMHSTVSNSSRITFTTAGKYFVNCQIAFSANDVGQRVVALVINGTGTRIADIRQFNSGAVNSTRFQASTIWDFAAAEYVECRVAQDTGGNLDVVASPNQSPEFMAYKLDN